VFDTHIYCLEGEEWRDISGYEGIYQVSSFGRVRTVDGKTTESIKHGTRKWAGRVMSGKGKNVKTGPRVSLWKDKKSKDYLVARLVCTEFHGVPEDPKMTVNHKDGNRFNNHISNLEWLSLADNIRHGFESGLYPTKKLKLKIGEEVREFNSLSGASRYLGRATGYASNCINKDIRMYTKFGDPVEILPF